MQFFDQFAFYSSADLAASLVNTQLKRFFSYQPDSEAELINARTYYGATSNVFQHFHALGRYYRKSNAAITEGILVVLN